MGFKNPLKRDKSGEIARPERLTETDAALGETEPPPYDQRNEVSTPAIPVSGEVDDPGEFTEATGSEATTDALRTEPAPEVRSVNGQFVVGQRSSLNSQPWWTSTWVGIPVAGEARDLDAVHGLVGDLAVFGLSLRGMSHQYEAIPNEDAFAIRSNDEWLVVAVSDGVSNAQHSSYTSRFLVNQVTSRLQKTLSAVPADTPINDLRSFVESAAAEANRLVAHWIPGTIGVPDVEPDEFFGAEPSGVLAATLTILLVSRNRTSGGQRIALVANIGDSPVYLLLGGEWYPQTPSGKDGEIMNTATVALPLVGFRPELIRWLAISVPDGAMICAVSDGISTSLASGATEVGRWLGARLASPAPLHELIDTVRFDRRGEDDDRTIVAVWTPAIRQISDGGMG